MKIIIWILKKIGGHFKENKLITTVYIISFLLSVLTLIFMYNNFMPSVIREAKNNTEDRYYVFDFKKEVQDVSGLDELFEKYNTECIEYLHIIADKESTDDNKDSDGEKIEIPDDFPEEIGDNVNVMIMEESTHGDESETGWPIIVTYKDDEISGANSKVEGRTEFTDEEREGNTLVGIFPAYTSVGTLPKSYTYNGLEYKAIGWSLRSYFIIPEKLFINQGFGVDSVIIYLKDTLTTMESNELINKITSTYQIKSMLTPEAYNDEYLGNSRQIIFMLSLGFAVMIFVFGYLIRYIVITSKSENMIYRLVGAGNGVIVCISALESLIANLILSIIAVIIHAALFSPIFNKLNFYTNVSLDIIDYLLLIGVTTFISFIAVLPHIVRSTRITLINNRNQI